MRIHDVRPAIRNLLSARARLPWPLVGALFFLAPIGAMCLARDPGVREARADVHRHTWGDETCLAESCIRGCCQQTCWAPCTYPGCGARDPRNKTRGDCPPPPREGSFGGGGATGSYSTALPISIWGPRPGGAGSDACPPHDWGEEKCGPWYQAKPDCKIRHCTHRCNKCGTNGKDHMEESPDGCM